MNLKPEKTLEIITLPIGYVNNMFVQLQTLVDEVKSLKNEIVMLNDSRRLPKNLTVNEAAKELRISTRVLRSYLASGKILYNQSVAKGKITIPAKELLKFKNQIK